MLLFKLIELRLSRGDGLFAQRGYIWDGNFSGAAQVHVIPAHVNGYLLIFH